MTWLPEWRVTVGNDVYTTVTAASYSTGRIDIDRQPTAGYARIEIVNADNSPFTIDVTDAVLLELKDSSGTYVTVFGGEVSDFSVTVRSPEEAGYITTGVVLAVGSLAKLTKAIYTAAIAEGLDGAQIAAIVNSALTNTWSQVSPSLTWVTYPPTVTWATAETYVGTIDSGLYTMISIAAGNEKSSNLIDLIANSAMGEIYESKNGFVNYDDADHRANYLATYGSTELDGTYATLTSVKSTLVGSRIRNSEIVRYGTGYASTYSNSDATSIATYGLYERKYDSNIKNLADITDIVDRDIALRATPSTQLEQVTFRLDNPSMPNALRNSLINIFFGQPVVITNLPSNMFGGYFSGFVEDMTLKATPTYTDMTLYVSPTDFSLVAPTWATVSPSNLQWTGVNAILQWTKAIGALT